MENYKEEIVSTRKGHLGGSDGQMLAQIASLGYVPKSAYKRMAIVKGLIEPQDHLNTNAIQIGNRIESEIYDFISQNNKAFQSNPLWESKKYSKKNCKLICHPDFVLEDHENKVLYCYECKATKQSVEDCKKTYKTQLFIEKTLAQERAVSFGSGWRVKMFLVVYDTNDFDLGMEFDPNRLSINEVRLHSNVFDINFAMGVVDEFLETFDVYSENEVIDAEMLPEQVGEKFTQVAQILREIKEREQKVEDFKTKLYDYLNEKGIMKVKFDDFSFTVVQPTTSVSWDWKKYLGEIEELHPRKAKRLKENYKKITNKKGYVNIRINDK